MVFLRQGETGLAEAELAALSALEERDMMNGGLESMCALSGDALERYQLHRTCAGSLGCVMRLRVETIEVNDEESLQMNFNGPSGQCVERLWSAEDPEEQCGGEDYDCDGFIDEGTYCD